MATVFFTPQLQRVTATPEVQTGAATLHEALVAAFAINPRLRGDVGERRRWPRVERGRRADLSQAARRR